jgi:hypothetical protein
MVGSVGCSRGIWKILSNRNRPNEMTKIEFIRQFLGEGVQCDQYDFIMFFKYVKSELRQMSRCDRFNVMQQLNEVLDGFQMERSIKFDLALTLYKNRKYEFFEQLKLLIQTGMTVGDRYKLAKALDRVHPESRKRYCEKVNDFFNEFKVSGAEAVKYINMMFNIPLDKLPARLARLQEVWEIFDKEPNKCSELLQMFENGCC